MTNLKRINDILAFVVSTATAVVELAEIWSKIGPDVKKTLLPVFDSCKKIASPNSNNNLIKQEF